MEFDENLRFEFDWDINKARSNLSKHKISFDEGKTVFNDPFTITIDDLEHSLIEDRYIDIGRSAKGRLITVSYTEHGDTIRIISCRKATLTEQNNYEKPSD